MANKSQALVNIHKEVTNRIVLIMIMIWDLLNIFINIQLKSTHLRSIIVLYVTSFLSLDLKKKPFPDILGFGSGKRVSVRGSQYFFQVC